MASVTVVYHRKILCYEDTLQVFRSVITLVEEEGRRSGPECQHITGFV